jgi:hypothetical protein
MFSSNFTQETILKIYGQTAHSKFYQSYGFLKINHTRLKIMKYYEMATSLFFFHLSQLEQFDHIIFQLEILNMVI